MGVSCQRERLYLWSAVNEIQPDSDGRYDAQEVIRWVMTRLNRIELNADDRETLLPASETGLKPDAVCCPTWCWA